MEVVVYPTRCFSHPSEKSPFFLSRWYEDLLSIEKMAALNGFAISWARGYKTFLMLNSVEHEIFLLINVKIPTNVGILVFMSGKNRLI